MPFHDVLLRRLRQAGEVVSQPFVSGYQMGQSLASQGWDDRLMSLDERLRRAYRAATGQLTPEEAQRVRPLSERPGLEWLDPTRHPWRFGIDVEGLRRTMERSRQYLREAVREQRGKSPPRALLDLLANPKTYKSAGTALWGTTQGVLLHPMDAMDEATGSLATGLMASYLEAAGYPEAARPLEAKPVRVGTGIAINLFAPVVGEPKLLVAAPRAIVRSPRVARELLKSGLELALRESEAKAKAASRLGELLTDTIQEIFHSKPLRESLETGITREEVAQALSDTQRRYNLLLKTNTPDKVVEQQGQKARDLRLVLDFMDQVGVNRLPGDRERAERLGSLLREVYTNKVDRTRLRLEIRSLADEESRLSSKAGDIHRLVVSDRGRSMTLNEMFGDFINAVVEQQKLGPGETNLAEAFTKTISDLNKLEERITTVERRRGELSSLAETIGRSSAKSVETYLGTKARAVALRRSAQDLLSSAGELSDEGRRTVEAQAQEILRLAEALERKAAGQQSALLEAKGSSWVKMFLENTLGPDHPIWSQITPRDILREADSFLAREEEALLKGLPEEMRESPIRVTRGGVRFTVQQPTTKVGKELLKVQKARQILHAALSRPLPSGGLREVVSQLIRAPSERVAQESARLRSMAESIRQRLATVGAPGYWRRVLAEAQAEAESLRSRIDQLRESKKVVSLRERIARIDKKIRDLQLVVRRERQAKEMAEVMGRTKKTSKEAREAREKILALQEKKKELEDQLAAARQSAEKRVSSLEERLRNAEARIEEARQALAGVAHLETPENLQAIAELERDLETIEGPGGLLEVLRDQAPVMKAAADATISAIMDAAIRSALDIPSVAAGERAALYHSLRMLQRARRELRAKRSLYQKQLAGPLAEALRGQLKDLGNFYLRVVATAPGAEVRLPGAVVREGKAPLEMVPTATITPPKDSVWKVADVRVNDEGEIELVLDRVGIGPLRPEAGSPETMGEPALKLLEDQTGVNIPRDPREFGATLQDLKDERSKLRKALREKLEPHYHRLRQAVQKGTASEEQRARYAHIVRVYRELEGPQEWLGKRPRQIWDRFVEVRDQIRALEKAQPHIESLHLEKVPKGEEARRVLEEIRKRGYKAPKRSQAMVDRIVVPLGDQAEGVKFSILEVKAKGIPKKFRQPDDPELRRLAEERLSLGEELRQLEAKRKELDSRILELRQNVQDLIGSQLRNQPHAAKALLEAITRPRSREVRDPRRQALLREAISHLSTTAREALRQAVDTQRELNRLRQELMPQIESTNARLLEVEDKIVEHGVAYRQVMDNLATRRAQLEMELQQAEAKAQELQSEVLRLTEVSPTPRTIRDRNIQRALQSAERIRTLIEGRTLAKATLKPGDIDRVVDDLEDIYNILDKTPAEVLEPYRTSIRRVSALRALELTLGPWQTLEWETDVGAKYSSRGLRRLMTFVRTHVLGTGYRVPLMSGLHRRVIRNEAAIGLEARLSYQALYGEARQGLLEHLRSLTQKSSRPEVRAWAENLLKMDPDQAMASVLRRYAKPVTNERWQALFKEWVNAGEAYAPSTEELAEIWNHASGSFFVAAAYPELFRVGRMPQPIRVALKAYGDELTKLVAAAKEVYGVEFPPYKAVVKWDFREGLTPDGSMLAKPGYPDAPSLKRRDPNILGAYLEVLRRVQRGEWSAFRWSWWFATREGLPSAVAGRRVGLFSTRMAPALRERLSGRLPGRAARALSRLSQETSRLSPLPLSEIFVSDQELVYGLPAAYLREMSNEELYRTIAQRFLKDPGKVGSLKQGTVLRSDWREDLPFKPSDLAEDWNKLRGVIERESPRGLWKYMSYLMRSFNSLGVSILLGDLSSLTLQGFSLLFSRPLAFFRAIGRLAHIMAMDDTAWALYLARPDNARLLSMAVNRGMGIGLETYIGGALRSRTVWEHLPLLRPMGKFMAGPLNEVLFTRFMTLLKLEALKTDLDTIALLRGSPTDIARGLINQAAGLRALEERYNVDLLNSTPEEIFDALVKLTNHQFGGTPRSETQLGVVREFLEHALFIVPGFMRSRLAFYGSLGRWAKLGDEASRIEAVLGTTLIAREALYALLVSGGLSALFGTYHLWLGKSLDPRSPYFGSVWLDEDTAINVYPTPRPLKELASLAGGRPGEEKDISSRADVLRFVIESREHPVVAQIHRQWTARDIFGNRRDTAFERAKMAIVATLPAMFQQPLVAAEQQQTEGRLSASDLLLETGGGVLGRQVRSRSPWDLLNTRFQDWQMRTFPEIASGDRPPLSWAEAPSRLKMMARESDPEIANLEARWESVRLRRATNRELQADMEFRLFEERQRQLDDMLNRTSALVQAGHITYEEWRERYKDIQRERAIAAEQLRRSLLELGIDLEKSSKEKGEKMARGKGPLLALALAEYESVPLPSKVVTFGDGMSLEETDWDAFEKARADVLAKYPKDIQEEVLRLREPKDDVAKRYVQAREVLDHYLDDVPRYRGLSVEDSQVVDRLIGLMREVEERVRNAGISPVNRRGLYTALVIKLVRDGYLPERKHRVLAALALRMATDTNFRQRMLNPESLLLLLRNPDVLRFYPNLRGDIPTPLRQLLPPDVQAPRRAASRLREAIERSSEGSPKRSPEGSPKRSLQPPPGHLGGHLRVHYRHPRRVI